MLGTGSKGRECTTKSAWMYDNDEMCDTVYYDIYIYICMLHLIRVYYVHTRKMAPDNRFELSR